MDIDLFLKISSVRSNGNPYVSYNLNATSPGKTLSILEISSFKILIPLSRRTKNFSSSILKVSLINDSALTSSG